MRTIDGVRFADSVSELSSEEKRQAARILADVQRDYLAKAPESFFASEHDRGQAEMWAQACAELQAVDSINMQRYMNERGLGALTQFQENGGLASSLLSQKLPKAPWE